MIILKQPGSWFMQGNHQHAAGETSPYYLYFIGLTSSNKNRTSSHGIVTVSLKFHKNRGKLFFLPRSTAFFFFYYYS